MKILKPLKVVFFKWAEEMQAPTRRRRRRRRRREKGDWIGFRWESVARGKRGREKERRRRKMRRKMVKR